MSAGALDARLSIHDVMPHTLDQVTAILELFAAHQLGAARLLVVPGHDWSPEQLHQLHAWQSEGHELAAHGWFHKARHIRGLKHRVHAAAVSRDVAEHLALDASEICQLMRDAAAWFVDQGLSRPQVYVPPAWALGSVSLTALSTTGYQRVEVTRGELWLDQGLLEHQLLLGFEADTRLRAAALGIWNKAQMRLARLARQPVRIAIHPHDLQLRLGGELRELLRQLSPSAQAF